MLCLALNLVQVKKLLGMPSPSLSNTMSFLISGSAEDLGSRGLLFPTSLSTQVFEAELEGEVLRQGKS